MVRQLPKLTANHVRDIAFGNATNAIGITIKDGDVVIGHAALLSVESFAILGDKSEKATTGGV